MILDHVTVPSAPVTEVGWRVRVDTYFDCTRFDITTDGDKWTTVHFWEGTPSAGAIVRAGHAIFAKYPGACFIEYEEIDGTWIPRVEPDEE